MQEDGFWDASFSLSALWGKWNRQEVAIVRNGFPRLTGDQEG